MTVRAHVYEMAVLFGATARAFCEIDDWVLGGMQFGVLAHVGQRGELHWPRTDSVAPVSYLVLVSCDRRGHPRTVQFGFKYQLREAHRPKVVTAFAGLVRRSGGSNALRLDSLQVGPCERHGSLCLRKSLAAVLHCRFALCFTLQDLHSTASASAHSKNTGPLQLTALSRKRKSQMACLPGPF